MPECLNVPAWRVASREELIAFTERKAERRDVEGSYLIMRSKLTQVDVYTYLRARFGTPNGFQNFLRKDGSDNLVHWDFNLRSGKIDVYIQGRMRDVAVLVSERMTDENWKELILALKKDFGRVGLAKSQVLKSFEKFLVFQNKFSVLAKLCGDLHASIVDAPPMVGRPPRLRDEADIEELKSAMESVSRRATNLYGDCLKLRLLTPIMAEAFLNMLILILVKDEIRSDRVRYDAFVREKMPEKLSQLHKNCMGFRGGVDRRSDGYKAFLRVMNARNFSIHGNIDPVRESIETVYFEGKRPLFSDNGDHLFKFFGSSGNRVGDFGGS
jgi:hypothetical protein